MNSGGLEAQGQLNHRGLWSGRWESNPHPKFGNLLSLLVGRLRSCGQGVGEGVAKRHGQDGSFGALQPPRNQLSYLIFKGLLEVSRPLLFGYTGYNIDSRRRDFKAQPNFL